MGKLQGFFNEVTDECKYLKEVYDNSVSYANTKDPEAYQFFVDKVGEEHGKTYADGIVQIHDTLNKIPGYQRAKARQEFVHNAVDNVKDAGQKVGAMAKAFGEAYKEGLDEDIHNLKTMTDEVTHGYAPSMVFGMNGDKPYTMKEAYEGLASEIKAAHDKEALHAKREAETEIFGVNNSNTASVEGQAVVE